MTVELSTPDGMCQPVLYHHVSAATGRRHVHVAGQIARDKWHPATLRVRSPGA